MIDRAKRAIDALRKPDAALSAVVNTIRQSIADVIEQLLNRRAADRKLIHQLGATVTLVNGGLDDEGDRVYLESTNDKDVLQRASDLYEEYRIANEDAGGDVGIP